jgi:hypothetical protein
MLYRYHFISVIGLITWLQLGVLALNTPKITFPHPGDAVQGVIVITGSTDVEEFSSAEVSFAYHSEDGNNDWFLIQKSEQPVSEGQIAVWDTTTITDGLYDLQLLIRLKDGSTTEVVVSELRARNYTPIETSTPQPTSAYLAIEKQQTPTAAAKVTAISPTILPTNSIEVTQGALSEKAVQGILATAIFMVVLGAYVSVRNWMQRK